MTCDLNRSEDQRQILDAATAMLAGSYPLGRLRGDVADDLSALAEFGAFLLALPEAQGGAGFTLVEEALVHTLFGRHLLSPRSLAAPIAARVALALGEKGLAEAIVTGEVAVATAVRTESGPLVIDPAGAGHALLFDVRRLELLRFGDSETAPGLGHDVALVRPDPAGLRSLGHSDAPELLDLADLLVSAQLLGVAEAARDLALDYAKVRRQFGRVIGGFQAIKHHCADMAIEAERISALLDMAALSLAGGRDDAGFQVAALRRLAPGAALRNARLCVQVHGGIGFSAEADAHRFVKQAHVLGSLGGGANLLGLHAPLSPFT